VKIWVHFGLIKSFRGSPSRHSLVGGASAHLALIAARGRAGAGTVVAAARRGPRWRVVPPAASTTFGRRSTSRVTFGIAAIIAAATVVPPIVLARTSSSAPNLRAISLDVTLLFAHEAPAFLQLVGAALVGRSAASATVAASPVRRAAPSPISRIVASSVATAVVSTASSTSALVGPVSLLAALPALVLALGSSPATSFSARL
jgi:hypothetical protein